MPNHNDEGRNLWGSARERDRRRARRDIVARVAAAASDDDASSKEVPSLSNNIDEHASDNVKDASNGIQELSLSNTSPMTEQEMDTIRQILRHVEAGKSSAFSLTTLSKHFDILNKPIPTSLLSPYKIKTLCTSRFGADHAQTIQEYINARESCTLFEYAAWLGEFKLLGPMIAGGLDPTQRGGFKNEFSVKDESRRGALAARIVKRFHTAFPSSLSSYIVKRVVDMRLQYWKEHGQGISKCTLCGSCNDSAQLLFGSSCRHSFCEHCFWQDLLEHIDERDVGDVVLCPVCGESNSSNENNNDIATDDLGHSPMERCQQSLEQYEALPTNTKELKQRPRSLKKRQRHLTKTWNEAVLQSVGSSQDVRNDKFFSYTEGNAYYYVRGCLIAGVDANATNEYGQTCLHIAAWHGYTKLVKLLLHFGADPTIRANGGISAESASESNGHNEIFQLLRQHSRSSPNDGSIRFQTDARQNYLLSSPKLETLIGLEIDHPGAGSYLIDDGFEKCIDSMIDLWRGLPVVHCDRKKKKGSNALCSVRSYYCDSEGHLCKLLTDVIYAAFAKTTQNVLVFPHMRFLHYAHAGSVLTPHTDLPRTDTSGNSSTHTLILYLYDCKTGGETSLLRAESGDGRKETMARVSPRRGRLFLFPHACPHEGNEVIDVPKVLIRGEVMLASKMNTI